MKKNTRYTEYYLVFIKKKSMFEIKAIPYSEYKHGIGRSDRNLLVLTEKWGKEKGDSEDKTGWSMLGKYYYIRRIAFVHSYYGIDVDVTGEKENIEGKGKAFMEMINTLKMHEIDILMGDLNYEVGHGLTDGAGTRKMPGYFKGKLFDKPTTIGGKKFDNILVRNREYATCNGTVVSIAISDANSERFSDHKGIMLEYDLYK